MFDAAFNTLPAKPEAISKDSYRKRQERLLSQFDVDDLIIVSSLPEATRSNDVHYPYRSSSDMLYMCGWSDPEATLLLYHDETEWVAHLFVQPKDTLMEIWEGRRPGVEGALKDWAVDRASPSNELIDHLEARVIVGWHLVPALPAHNFHRRPGVLPRLAQHVKMLGRRVLVFGARAKADT